VQGCTGGDMGRGNAAVALDSVCFGVQCSAVHKHSVRHKALVHVIPVALGLCGCRRKVAILTLGANC
jgi:hypothetical protein